VSNGDEGEKHTAENPRMRLETKILLWLGAYGCAALGVGLLNYGRTESSQHFLHTSKNLPFWVVSISFLATNCSALEVLAMVAVAAKYGLYAVHFYWIGAIPALAFLICVLLPFYECTGVKSIPEFLEQRFGKGTRLLSAACFCMTMVAIAGITICAFSRLAHLTLGWSYGKGIWSLAAISKVFLISGGLSAVLYGEAVQLIIFLLVLLPLTMQILTRSHGLRHLIAGLPVSAQHTFAGLPFAAPKAPADVIGTVAGLGLVLGFSYWCADFLLIQRLLAARSDASMKRTPMLSIVAKLVLPLILVIPGLVVMRAYRTGYVESYDLALPRLLIACYPEQLLAIALAAILASLFIGTCGNLAACVAIFNHDLYQPFLRPGLTDKHYLQIARLTTVVAAIASAEAANIAFASNSLMEYVQLVLSSLNTPLATTLLLGIFVPRVTRQSGLPGMLAGTLVGIAHSILILGGYLHYGSGLTASFYSAMIAAGTTALTISIISFLHVQASFAY
jgi:SSS family solute:Na+ symporter